MKINFLHHFSWTPRLSGCARLTLAVALTAFTFSAKGQAYTIPVVVHVLWSNPIANISDAQVMDGLNILNQGFDTATFHPVDPPYNALAASMDIAFCLASTAPDGTPTTGIDRIQTPQATHGGMPASYMNQWPPDRYMNIWLVQNVEFGVYPGTLSPAQADTAPAMDGLMFPSDWMGSIGTSNYYDSFTIIFNAGRYMGLKLLWQDSIPGSLCGDDGIADTPPSPVILNCFPEPDSCAGNMPLMVENYMTYSYCGRMFTAGQRDYVYTVLNSPLAQRNNLWTAANLALAGCGPLAVNSPDPPELHISALGSAGRWRVQFPTDQSWSLAVYNSTGSLVGVWHGDHGLADIDLHGQSAGLYVLQASNANGKVITAKLALP